MRKLIKDIHHLGYKEKLLIAIILLLCFIGGFTLSIYWRKSYTDPITGSPPKLAEVSLTPTSITGKSGDSFDIQLNLSSADAAVEAADFIVRYDPAFIRIDNISLGNFFQNYPIKRIDYDYIKISAVASFVSNKIVIPKGKGTIATIHITAFHPTDQTIIYFDLDKTVIASTGRNILGKTNSLTLSIQ